MIRRAATAPGRPPWPARALLSPALPAATVLATAALLAGCATAPVRAPNAAPAAAPVPRLKEAGLERVMGKTAAQLATLFGPADLDLHEGAARKLQFVGPACVLDTYLYPPRDGAAPVVSYLDARRPDGEDIDRASCVAALARRDQAK